VKYLETQRFRKDLKTLSKRGHAPEFSRVMSEKFMPAAERFAANRGSEWPTGLRVKGVTNAPGVWEFSWSMNNPDGRATFEWISIDGEPAIRLRRVGDHSIFQSA
jgi:hypothetical protein